MNSPQIERIKKTRFYLLLGAFTVLVWAGIWFTQYRSHIADLKIRNQMLADATELAHAINISLVKELTFTAEDKDSPGYHRICHQMRAYSQLIQQQGIYSMKLVEGNIYFGPESYLENDPDASPPGTLYEEPSDTDFEVFRSGIPAVFGPITDEYGSFISALAPVIDPLTGQTLMVVGIDIPAQIHQKTIRNSRYLPISLTGVLFLLLIAGYIMLKKRLYFDPQKKAKYRFVEPALVLVSGIIVTIAITILSTEAGKSEKEQIFDSKSFAFTAIFQNAVHQIQEDIETIHKYASVSSSIHPDNFTSFIQPLASVSMADAFLWAPVNRPLENWKENFSEIFFNPDFTVPQNASILPTGNNPFYGNTFIQAIEESVSTCLITSCDSCNVANPPINKTRLLALKSVLKTHHGKNEEQHPDTLAGIAAALITWQKMLDISLKGSGQFKEHFETIIFDLTPAKPHILASLPDETNVEIHDLLAGNEKNNRAFMRIVPLFFFGKTMAIIVKSTPAFHNAYPMVTGRVSLITGLLITLMLTFFVAFQRNRQYFLEQSVNERTSELNQRVKELTCLNRINDELRLSQHPVELFQNISHHLRQGMQYPDMVFPEIVIDDKQYLQDGLSHNYPVGISQDIVRFGKVAGKIDLRFSQPLSFLPEEKTMLDQVAQLLSQWLERKQAETNLHQRESEMQAFLKAATESIFLIDTKGLIITANEESSRRFNTPLNQLIGNNIFNFLPANHARFGRKKLNELMETGAPVRFEMEQGGRIFYINLSPVRNQDEAITNIAVFGIDITERKNIETELKKAMEKVEASDKLKTAFLNNISHEVRTPLNGILGFADIISQPGLSQHEIDQCLDILNVSSKRLIDTINDYMDMSHIVSGNLQISRQPFYISKTLMEINDDFDPFCKAKNLTLKTTIAENNQNLVINQDEELIRKVISQLVDNAIKFSSNGTVAIGFDVAGTMVQFFVKDEGIGISNEAINRIFENFVQEDTSSTRQHEGSGLGLSIAKGIIGLLGGTIRVESTKGMGSSFYFTIPIDPNQNAVTKPETESRLPIQSQQLLILIAEDDELGFMFLENVLSKTNLQLMRAKNGLEAVEMCRQHTEIALVLMDLKMPLMDGYEATRQIKTFRTSLPIIAITAFAMSGDERKALEAGCDDYLAKPLKINVLMKKLENFQIFFNL